jgi:hypothetical protein
MIALGHIDGPGRLNDKLRPRAEARTPAAVGA